MGFACYYLIWSNWGQEASTGRIFLYVVMSFLSCSFMYEVSVRGTGNSDYFQCYRAPDCFTPSNIWLPKYHGNDLPTRGF